MTAFGHRRRINANVVFALFAFVFQIRVDLAGIHGQFATCQIERVLAGRSQECPIMRHNQTSLIIVLQKMLEEDLCAQVEEVRRFVQQQEIRFMQQQCRQLNASLPATRQLGNRTVEVRPFDFELASNFATFPVRLAAVPFQELLSTLTRQERIVLAEVTQVQIRMPDDFSMVEFLFAQQDA